MSSLRITVAALEKYTEQWEIRDERISAASVGWHIDHCLKVIHNVCEALKSSDPQMYKSNFNFIRLYIFLRGSIPRGKGEAPKSVRPKENIHPEGLLHQAEKVKQLLTEIEELPKKSNFKHPYFGVLNLNQTRKFLKIHTKHHLKIIQDICTD